MGHGAYAADDSRGDRTVDHGQIACPLPYPPAEAGTLQYRTLYLQWISSFTVAPYSRRDTTHYALVGYGATVMELGLQNKLNTLVPFTVPYDSTLILGAEGKTTLLTKLALDAIYENRLVTVFDPNGAMVAEILSKIPKSRQSDVVLLNPTFQPFALNVLSRVPFDQHPLMSSVMTDTLVKKGITPYREYTFRTYFKYGISTLLSVPNTHLLYLKKLFTDEQYLNHCLKHITDPFIKDFWETYKGLDPKVQRQEVESTLSRLYDLTFEPLIRNYIGQKKNSLTFKDKIVLVSLSEAQLGGENVGLLADILLALLYMEGIKGLETFLVLDDVERFQGAILDRVMTRCPQIHAVLSVQYLGLFPKERVPTILGGVRQVVAFRTSIEDSHKLEPVFNLENNNVLPRLHQLSPHEAIVGRESTPTRIHTHLNSYPPTHQARKIMARCASQFTQPRQSIERNLRRMFQ